MTQDETLSISADAWGIETPIAHLLATRNGSGDGRVYYVSLLASDGNGGQCMGTVTVCVPHDRGNHKI
jgi:hypothetical protein